MDSPSVATIDLNSGIFVPRVRIGIASDNVYTRPIYAYGSGGDAAMVCCSNEDAELLPLETRPIHLGFKLDIPAGWCMRVEGRSSHAGEDLFVHPETFGSNYTEEICAVVTNLSGGTYWIERFDRICQIVLATAWQVEFTPIAKERA